MCEEDSFKKFSFSCVHRQNNNMGSLEWHEGEQMLKNVDRIFIFVVKYSFNVNGFEGPLEVDKKDTAVMLWFA